MHTTTSDVYRNKIKNKLKTCTTRHGQSRPAPHSRCCHVVNWMEWSPSRVYSKSFMKQLQPLSRKSVMLPW